MKKGSLLRKTAVATLCLTVVIGLGLYFWVLYDLPSPENFATYIPPSGNYIPVPLSEIPEMLHWATVVTEDKAFYSRSPRVGLPLILRSIWYNLDCAGHECLRIRGATIPQQLVAALMLTSGKNHDRSLRQDMRDLALTIMITQRYTRDEILEFYLNSGSYAGQIYGVEAAAQFYFGKHVRDLNLAECAMLPAIARMPDFEPLADLEIAQERQATVLDLMAENGYINELAANLAKEELVFFEP